MGEWSLFPLASCVCPAACRVCAVSLADGALAFPAVELVPALPRADSGSGWGPAQAPPAHRSPQVFSFHVVIFADCHPATQPIIGLRGVKITLTQQSPPDDRSTRDARSAPGPRPAASAAGSLDQRHGRRHGRRRVRGRARRPAHRRAAVGGAAPPGNQDSRPAVRVRLAVCIPRLTSIDAVPALVYDHPIGTIVLRPAPAGNPQQEVRSSRTQPESAGLSRQKSGLSGTNLDKSGQIQTPKTPNSQSRAANPPNPRPNSPQNPLSPSPAASPILPPTQH